MHQFREGLSAILNISSFSIANVWKENSKHFSFKYLLIFLNIITMFNFSLYLIFFMQGPSSISRMLQ